MSIYAARTQSSKPTHAGQKNKNKQFQQFVSMMNARGFQCKQNKTPTPPFITDRLTRSVACTELVFQFQCSLYCVDGFFITKLSNV